MGKLLGGGPIIESECSNIRCCSSSQPNVYDARLATLPTTWGQRGVSDQSTASEISRTPFRFRAARDAAHAVQREDGSLQSSDRRRLPVHRSGPEPLLDRPGPGHQALGTSTTRSCPWGPTPAPGWQRGYPPITPRPPTWRPRTPSKSQRILSDAELRDLFPNGPGYPQGAYATSPQSINHLLGGSYIDGALQIFP